MEDTPLFFCAFPEPCEYAGFPPSCGDRLRCWERAGVIYAFVPVHDEKNRYKGVLI
jgi:hypothetical protein